MLDLFHTNRVGFKKRSLIQSKPESINQGRPKYRINTKQTRKHKSGPPKIQNKHKNTKNTTHTKADDTHFVGPSDGEAVTRAVKAFTKECAARGLMTKGSKGLLLNFSKAELHKDTVEYTRSEGIPINCEAAVLIGAPMGPNREEVARLAQKEIGKGKRFFESLAHPEMPAVIGDRMLRAAGIPRPNYLQGGPPFRIQGST